MKTCSHCKQKIPLLDRYCVYCGSSQFPLSLLAILLFAIATISIIGIMGSKNRPGIPNPTTYSTQEASNPLSQDPSTIPSTKSGNESSNNNSQVVSPKINSTQKPVIGGMVEIPSGSFMMGASEADALWHYQLCNRFSQCNKVDYEDLVPKHEVYVDAFTIDIHEVTNGQFRKCVDAGTCALPSSPVISDYLTSDYFSNSRYENYPVVGINWEEAKTYCDWVEKRLPTEAEWEKAAKGGVNSLYPWKDYGTGFEVGNIFNGEIQANYCDKNCLIKDGDWKDNSLSDNWAGPAPVMSFSPNNYGIYDLSGNVQEWILDYYSEDYYTNSEWNNPINRAYNDWVVTRGGGWNNGIYHLTTMYRRAGNQYKAKAFLGFRCVK